MKILFAEDTKDLNRVVSAALSHAGYDVDSAFDGVEASEFLDENGYDVIVLDIMMPRKDGMQVLKELRARKIMTPVIMLTAKTEVDDRVAGLDAGADDYLTKPFAMKELLARVRAMSRRKTDYSSDKMEFGDIRLDGTKFELACENSVRLSVKEYELMQTLILNGGKELDEQYLLEHVWSDASDAGSDTVFLYVMYLRGKLRAIASKVVIGGEKGGAYKLEKL